MTKPINYGRISRALEFYQSRGYEYIEVPWIATAKAIGITFPEVHPKNKYHLKGNNYLVGSAEQSFLQLIMDCKLGAGRYVAVTPCFREEEPTKLNHPYFMKVELFECKFTGPLWLLEHKLIETDAFDFFSSELLREGRNYKGLQLINTNLGTDIEFKGIELGSYGIRESSETLAWHYGTGLAEPRFSQALSYL